MEGYVAGTTGSICFFRMLTAQQKIGRLEGGGGAHRAILQAANSKRKVLRLNSGCP